MINIPVEKGNNMQEHMGNVSRETETLRINRECENRKH